jgi:hypothetical protein
MENQELKLLGCIREGEDVIIKTQSFSSWSSRNNRTVQRELRIIMDSNLIAVFSCFGRQKRQNLVEAEYQNMYFNLG